MYYFSNSSRYSKASEIIEINKKYQFNDTYIYILNMRKFKEGISFEMIKKVEPEKIKAEFEKYEQIKKSNDANLINDIEEEISGDRLRIKQIIINNLEIEKMTSRYGLYVPSIGVGKESKVALNILENNSFLGKSRISFFHKTIYLKIQNYHIIKNYDISITFLSDNSEEKIFFSI